MLIIGKTIQLLVFEQKSLIFETNETIKPLKKIFLLFLNVSFDTIQSIGCEEEKNLSCEYFHTDGPVSITKSSLSQFYFHSNTFSATSVTALKPENTNDDFNTEMIFENRTTIQGIYPIRFEKADFGLLKFDETIRNFF